MGDVAVAEDTLTLNDALSEIHLLARHDDAQALARYDELLLSYPDAVRVIRARAQAREHAGDVPNASADFERVLDIVPDDLTCMIALARCKMKAGHSQEALITARQVLDHDATERDALIFLRMSGESPDRAATGRIGAARQRFAGGQHKPALVALRQFVNDHPDRPDAEIALAEMLWRMDRPIAAAEMCGHILDNDDDCLAAHVLLHKIWLQARSPAQANVHLAAIERLDPDRRFIAMYMPDLAAGVDVVDVPAIRPRVEAAAALAIDEEDFVDEGAIETEDWVSELAASSATNRTRITTPEEDAEGPVETYSPLDWLPTLGPGDAADQTAAEPAPERAAAPVAVAAVASHTGGESQDGWVKADQWQPAGQQPDAAKSAPAAEPSKKPKQKASDALAAAETARENGDYRASLRQLERVVNKGKKPKETVAQLETLVKQIPEGDAELRAEAYRVLGDAYLNADRNDDAMQAYRLSSQLLK